MAYLLIERTTTTEGTQFNVQVLSELDKFSPETIDPSHDFVLEDYNGNVLEYRLSGFHHRSSRR
jgi:hypothetical protein